MTKKIYAEAPDKVPDAARDYITPGKRYPLVPHYWDCDERGLCKSGRGFAFRNDQGDVGFAKWEDSIHLGGGNWTRLEVGEPAAPDAAAIAAVTGTYCKKGSKMTDMINDGGPAFPVKVRRNTSTDPLATSREFQMPGMTLRDWFAGQALAGQLANPQAVCEGVDGVANLFAKDAYVLADAMIAARKKGK